MTRLLLTWIGLAILQLGAARETGAAELRAAGESTRAIPQLEMLSGGVLARDSSRSWELRGTHAPPFAPAAQPRPRLTASAGALPPQEPRRRGPVAFAHLLPAARAPPA